MRYWVLNKPGELQSLLSKPEGRAYVSEHVPEVKPNQFEYDRRSQLVAWTEDGRAVEPGEIRVNADEGFHASLHDGFPYVIGCVSATSSTAGMWVNLVRVNLAAGGQPVQPVACRCRFTAIAVIPEKLP